MTYNYSKMRDFVYDYLASPVYFGIVMAAIYFAFLTTNNNVVGSSQDGWNYFFETLGILGVFGFVFIGLFALSLWLWPDKAPSCEPWQVGMAATVLFFAAMGFIVFTVVESVDRWDKHVSISCISTSEHVECSYDYQ